MVVRVVSALACLAVGTHAAEEVKRRFPDDEVIASQRYFSHAWRDHFNDGDAKYCGSAYLVDASVHAVLGPAAADLKRLVGLSDPAVVHGRSAITDFWNESMRAGLKDFHAYDNDGEYASTAFAVDDDTVVIEGKFSFNNAVRGQIFSELWIRKDAEWKLKGMMLAIQEMDPGFALGVAAGSEPTHQEGGLEAANGTSPGTEANSTEANSTELGELPAAAPVVGSGNGPLLLLVLMMTCGIAAILMRRSRRRREASIAGFEAMLG
mmetsp:Transcript_3260/g.8984  ORF Transcript_3260/g.8984 Transcript_3260/m.8984 type:complete len:265 (-) Transcript_3260:190-984(-)